MKITILNGNSEGRNKNFEQYMEKLCIFLEKQGHSVKHVKLRSMDIRYCTGCFGCWQRKPGECVIPDDSAQVCAAVVNAESVIFASPLMMGFVSAVLKKTMDKLIPLLHPYIEIVNGEFHHKKRYDTYPVMSFLYEKTEKADEEDVAITTDILRRVALNLRTRFQFAADISTRKVEEVINEINSL